MSTSRRKFLRTGLLATMCAAIPLKSILGQSWKDRDGNPGETPITQSDVLGNYSKATFTSYLNSIFQFQTSFGIVDVTLARIDDMPSTKGGECFTLLFRGGSRELPQGTYTVTHASLGNFALLLVPAGADQNGAQGYLATVNRISAADFASLSAPSRIVRTSPSSTPATTGPPATTTSGPVTSPNTGPVGPTTIAPATPAPKPKKHRRRKPSRKNDDDQRLNLGR